MNILNTSYFFILSNKGQKKSKDAETAQENCKQVNRSHFGVKVTKV